jgi:multicomponent Na+:H+ antiporter subunit D
MGAVTAILPNRSMAWWFTFFRYFNLYLHLLLAFFSIFILIAFCFIPWAAGPPPHGISLIVDGLSAPILLLISAMAMLTVIYALPASISEIEPKKRGTFLRSFFNMLCRV